MRLRFTSLFISLLFITNTTLLQAKEYDLIIKNIALIDALKKSTSVKTVFISSGKIIKISRRYSNQKAKQILDGRGKFLMYGMTEMHTHLPADSSLLGEYCSNLITSGMTSARIMYSPVNIDKQRTILNAQKIKPEFYYPYILLKNDSTFLKMDQKEVVEFKEKYDFVKFYSYHLSPHFGLDSFEQLMKYCNQNELMICGHYPANLDWTMVLSSGFRSIEHLGGYIDLGNDSIVDKAIQLTKEKQVYNCPTLDWDYISYNLFYPDDLPKRITTSIATEKQLTEWNNSLMKLIDKYSKDTIIQYKEEYMPVFQKKCEILKKMNEEGCCLLVGAEGGKRFQLDGYNMYEEMLHWEQIGINRFDILKCATYNPALFFNETDQKGTIDTGKIADLLILDKDPTIALRNIQTVSLVIKAGEIIVSPYTSNQ